MCVDVAGWDDGFVDRVGGGALDGICGDGGGGGVAGGVGGGTLVGRLGGRGGGVELGIIIGGGGMDRRVLSSMSVPVVVMVVGDVVGDATRFGGGLVGQWLVHCWYLQVVVGLWLAWLGWD